MRLRDALGVMRGDVIAFTGAGGKTSAMVQLGYELASDHWRVLATTTTRIATTELEYFPCVVQWNPSLLDDNYRLIELLDANQFVFVYQEIVNDKAVGIAPGITRKLVDSVNSDALIIEADGSRRLPLKAPLEHEPVIPADTTLAVPVAGLDVLDKPFTESNVYNIEAIIDRYGFGYDMSVVPAWLAQVLRDPEFGLKGIPEHARVMALLNKTTTSKMSLNPARRAARMILQEPRFDGVVIGAVKNRNRPVFEVQRRVAAIVLAGGLSRRMGRSKMLLPWGNRTVIETVVNKLLPFKLADFVVVTGYKSDEVEAKLKDMAVRTVYNPHFAAGEMLSSLKVGLEALPDHIDSVMVFLGDQPQVKPAMVNQILTTYAETCDSIIAPQYRGKRGHPILINRRHWQDILNLPHGKAPRDALNQYPIHTIRSDDDSIIRDIDTPEQYQQELKLAGLA